MIQMKVIGKMNCLVNGKIFLFKIGGGGGGGGGGGYQLHSVGREVSIQGNSFLGVDKKLLQTSEEEFT